MLQGHELPPHKPILALIMLAWSSKNAANTIGANKLHMHIASKVMRDPDFDRHMLEPLEIIPGEVTKVSSGFSCPTSRCPFSNYSNG